jgi:hypothetical protein
MFGIRLTGFCDDGKSFEESLGGIVHGSLVQGILVSPGFGAGAVRLESGDTNPRTCSAFEPFPPLTCEVYPIPQTSSNRLDANLCVFPFANSATSACR